MALLCISLAIACIFDYGRGRIPNLLVVFIGGIGIARSFLEAGPGGVPGFLARAGCVAVLLYPAFRIGALGAGDLKLLGVAAGYFPIRKVLYFLFFSMLIAAIISIFHVIKEHNAQERLRCFCGYCRDVIHTGDWKLYFVDKEIKFMGICLTGPILCSALLYWGGVY